MKTCTSIFSFTFETISAYKQQMVNAVNSQYLHNVASKFIQISLSNYKIKNIMK